MPRVRDNRLKTQVSHLVQLESDQFDFRLLLQDANIASASGLNTNDKLTRMPIHPLGRSRV
jgi:hypothetical protein